MCNKITHFFTVEQSQLQVLQLYGVNCSYKNFLHWSSMKTVWFVVFRKCTKIKRNDYHERTRDTKHSLTTYLQHLNLRCCKVNENNSHHYFISGHKIQNLVTKKISPFIMQARIHFLTYHLYYFVPCHDAIQKSKGQNCAIDKKNSDQCQLHLFYKFYKQK